MNKITTLTIAALLAGASTVTMAENTSAAPHKKSPDSTSQGDYMKDQPNENSMEHGNSSAGANNQEGKASNLQKGKSHKEKPDAGGVDVRSK